jgi:DNA-binding transcriptional LysR family regulator
MIAPGNRGDRLHPTRTLDLQQLRLALAACDHGSFRRAAAALSIKHNVLSRSIARLEHQVGTSLFERSSGGIKPTLAGRAVLQNARVILAQVDTLIDAGRIRGRGEAGHLAMGFCTSISTGNLRAVLTEFKERLPRMEVAAVERSRHHLLNALRSGTVDIVVTPGRLLSRDTKALPLWSERILILLPQHHGLAARELTSWTDLRNETVLLSRYDPGEELQDLLTSKLALPEDRPRIDRHDVSRSVVKNLVSMGMGVSLVMESDIGANNAGLVYRELQDETGPSRIGFYAHWRDDNANPALKLFLKLLAERHPSASLLLER